MRPVHLLAAAGLAASALPVAAGTCPRVVTALTSDCENSCFPGRPCVAFTAADAAAGACVNSSLALCRTSAASDCAFACLKYGRDDFVENNVLDYSSFTFLVPFGAFVSKWEQNWNATVAQAASASRLPNDTDKFPSVSDDWVSAIEPLEFLPSTTSIAIAGGSSVQGIQGRVSDVELSSQVFLGVTGVKTLTLANLKLAEVAPSSFPSQLVDLSLTNCVLSTLPNDLLSMPHLKRLDLSKNYLKAFPSKFSLSSLTSLNLSTNNLDTFDAILPNLTTLDLSDNLLTAVPTSIFSMPALKELDLRKNSFTNVQLTQAQIDFLSKIPTLRVDTFGVPSCSSESQRKVADTVVCLPSTNDSTSPANESGNAGKSGGSNTAAVIGGVVGGIAALLVVAAVALYIRRRRHTRTKEVRSDTITPGFLGGSTHSGASSEQASSLWNDPELMALKLNSDDIEDVRKIGSGAYSVVFLVNYRKHRYAAAKRLKKDELSWHNTQRFASEIKLVKQLQHPRVVTLIGVSWTTEADLQALFEYMESGDLRTYVERPSTPRQWTMQKLQIALDVVEALVYVHSFTPALVHRDLKSRNILLDKELRAKLSDFGVARFRSDHATMTTGVGTGRWLAPEVIAGSNDYDQSSDMFAFGVVMSELDTHELPYEDIRGASGNRLADVALLQMVAAGKLVPTFSRSCPAEILKLAMRCLAYEPRARPTAVEVAYALRTIIRSMEYYSM